MIYAVSLCDEDSYCPEYLEGPVIENFGGLCDKMMKEACTEICKLKETEKCDSKTIWMHSLINLVMTKLRDYGYTRIKMTERTYSGFVPDLNETKHPDYELLKEVIEHNAKYIKRQYI